MGILAWFKRLFGGKPREAPNVAPEGRTRGSMSAADLFPGLGQATRRAAGMSAAEVLRKVAELQKAGAGWPEIWTALNPDGEAEAQRLLVELRGPHLFAPHVGLNVLEDGCRRALAADPHADRLAALRAALKSGRPITDPD
jgi:hypothetical protein